MRRKLPDAQVTRNLRLISDDQSKYFGYIFCRGKVPDTTVYTKYMQTASILAATVNVHF